MPGAQWFQHDIPTGYPWLAIHWYHFDAYHPNGDDCWALSGKTFDREAKMDPLMGSDLDFDNVDLVMKLHAFGSSFRSKVPVDGYRFDAVKHIRPHGTLSFLTHMRTEASRALFAVGEYFSTELDELKGYLHSTLGQISLFDFALQRKFVHISRAGSHSDLRDLVHGSLTAEVPVLSVGFVHSHDDQPPVSGHEHRGEYVGQWFISQAYAFLLMRDEGYPMVSGIDLEAHPDLLARLLLARAHCTYGWRHDQFDHANTVGWSFGGTPG